MGELEKNISNICEAHTAKLATDADFEAKLDESRKSQVRCFGAHVLARMTLRECMHEFSAGCCCRQPLSLLNHRPLRHVRRCRQPK